MTDAFRWANEGLAFLLELTALGALCYWGFTTGRGRPVKAGLGIGAPLLAAVVWGLFASPDATFAIPLAGALAVKALVFGAATAALYASAKRNLAIAYGAVTLVNTIIVTIIRKLQRRLTGTQTFGPSGRVVLCAPLPEPRVRDLDCPDVRDVSAARRRKLLNALQRSQFQTPRIPHLFPLVWGLAGAMPNLQRIRDLY